MSSQDDPHSPPDFAAQLQEDLPPADVRHVLSVFHADLRRLTGILAVTVAARDIDSFRRSAHALAGAAGAVGAAGLEDASRAAMACEAPADMAALYRAVQAQAGETTTALDLVLRRLDDDFG